MQDLLAEDAEILELLDLEEPSDEELASRIIKRSQWDDLAESVRRINIYFRPSRRAANEIITGEILQVDCHVPSNEDYVAWRVMKRVRELLHKQKVGDMIYHFDGQLGELPTMPNFFCAGTRYMFYRVI